jgi:hypothetical protein
MRMLLSNIIFPIQQVPAGDAVWLRVRRRWCRSDISRWRHLIKFVRAMLVLCIGFLSRSYLCDGISRFVVIAVLTAPSAGVNFLPPHYGYIPLLMKISEVGSSRFRCHRPVENISMKTIRLVACSIGTGSRHPQPPPS